MYAPPQEIPLQLFSKVPPHLDKSETVSHMARRRPGMKIPAFLEGPAFDRAGNLLLVDIAHGRLFSVTPDGTWTTLIQYDGHPNGIAIHKDGRVFVADAKNGIMIFDPASAKMTPFVTELPVGKLKGPNDLMFAENGDLYFTDQGETGLHDPTGRLVRVRASGAIEVLLDNVPSPNGLAVRRDGQGLFLAVTRDNAVWYVPFLGPEQAVGRVGRFAQLIGGAGGGPDGLAMDAEGNLVICQVVMGSVWVFSALGEPMYRMRTCAGPLITNAAYGGPDGKTLFVTESQTGAILQARLPVAGMALYAHQ
jgi:gluconolactonase